VIANYLLWRFVRHRANNLDDRFQEAKQQFYYVLFGREESPPRWKNCIVEVNNHLGMAVGAMFVRKYFDEYSKNDVSIHSFHWDLQNSTIPCRSQELLPFLSVMYFFLPPFPTNYSSILSHPILHLLTKNIKDIR